MVSFRLPQIVIQQIDDWATSRGIRRSEAIRAMIEATLKLDGLG